jgi:hypothetical protein
MSGLLLFSVAAFGCGGQPEPEPPAPETADPVVTKNVECLPQGPDPCPTGGHGGRTVTAVK